MTSKGKNMSVVRSEAYVFNIAPTNNGVVLVAGFFLFIFLPVIYFEEILLASYKEYLHSLRLTSRLTFCPFLFVLSLSHTHCCLFILDESFENKLHSYFHP